MSRETLIKGISGSAEFFRLARLIRLIGLYRNQQNEAGQFVHRIEREMNCLWLFLQENGVAPTNNHAERTLRFAVLWRKRSFGTSVEKGDRFVERILSLRQTCRLQGKRPDLFWLYTIQSDTP